MDTLFKRFITQGTLSDPKGIPDPTFALPSTVNWMKALRLVVQSENVNFKSATSFYSSIQKRMMSDHELNTTFEQLILAIHCLASLNSMQASDRISDIVRMASIAWYYGVYSSASSMIVAQDGKQQDTHLKTANVWDNQFVRNGKVMLPFSLSVSDLTSKTISEEIEILKNGNKHKLISAPQNEDEAWGALCEYLSGSAHWWKGKVEKKLKEQKSFRDLGVSNFRSNAARQMRDNTLNGRKTSFIHQAIRYRGKANYREALFLAYGENTETIIKDFIVDLNAVLEGFLAMSGAFVSRKIGKEYWNWFVNELSANRSISLNPHDIWPNN